MCAQPGTKICSEPAAFPRLGVAVVDELEQATVPRDEPRMGWGPCSVSGCPCQSFVQTYGSELCNNCGHRYHDHW